MGKKKTKEKKIREQIKKEGLQRNLYLEKLGLDIHKYGVNFCGKGDRRWSDWKKERKLYGFDNRETWCIEPLFVEWIYSRFKMYLEQTVVDLEYYKIPYQKDPDAEPIMVTQKKAIKIIMKMCRDFLLKNDEDYASARLDPSFYPLLSELMPLMWW